MSKKDFVAFRLTPQQIKKLDKMLIEIWQDGLNPELRNSPINSTIPCSYEDLLIFIINHLQYERFKFDNKLLSGLLSIQK